MTHSGRFSMRERQIMEILYRLGSASVAEVRDEMDDAPSYSSVRALLAILERKRHVQHRQDGARFVYLPVRLRDEEAQSALSQLVRTFFGGSVEQVVASLVSDSEGALTEEELARIARIIEDARRSER